MAGGESDRWHPLVDDFILLGRKLEQHGFIYSKGQVIFIDAISEARS